MAEDANARIRVDIDTAAALANIKNLQRQISTFHTSLAKSGAAASAASMQMQQQLLNSINKTGQFSATLKNVRTTTDSFTNSLEKNKLSMGEYFRYSGAATKTFGRFFRTEFDTINKVARERVKDLQTQYVKMGRDANGAMRAIAVRPLALDMENLSTKTQIAAQRQALLNQLLKQGSTNLLNFGKNTQWAGRQLMVGFTVPLVMLGSVASKTFMDMEKQAVRFKRVYGELFTTGEETDKALRDIKNLANEFTRYGIAVSKTMELAADIAATGRMGADLNAQVAETTRLAVLGGVEQSEALQATISLTDAFGVSAEELAGKIDFLNAVENQTITSIEDLTIAIPKAGPVVQQLGGDVEDLTFFLTAMREGGINASEGANALKSGLAALINPTGKASEMLQGFGINVKGIVEGNAGDVKGLVVDFAKALDTLDPLNRARAIEQLFGKFQFSRLSTLFQNVIKEGNQASRVLTLTNATAEELAILSERELKRVEDSPMFKFQKAIEDIKVTLVPLGEAFLKAVTPILEFGTRILKKFDELDEGAKSFVVGLTAIAGVIGPVFLMGFGLVANGVANVVKGFVFFKTAMNKASSASSHLGMQTEYMTRQQLEASAVAASLDQVHQRLRQTFTSEAAAVNALTAAYQRSIAAQAGMTGGAVGRTRPGLKLASGIMSVPGPRGAGDVVPAMLSPGEAVIPAKQSKKYSGIISSLIADNVPGFRIGRNPFASMLGRSKVAVRMKDQDFISGLRQDGKNARYKSAFDTQTGADYIMPSGSKTTRQRDLRSAMERDVFGLDPKTTPTSARPTYGYAKTPILSSFINRLFGLKGKNFNAVTRNPGKDSLDKYGNIDLITKGSVAKRSSAFAGDALVNYNWATHANTKRRSPNLNIPIKNTGISTAPMRGASAEQLNSFGRLGSPFKKYENNPPAYVETYTPGGFAFNEIDKIIARDPKIAKALKQELRAAGLGSVRVTGSNFVQRLFKQMGIPGYNQGTESVGPLTRSAAEEFARLKKEDLASIRSTTRGGTKAVVEAHKGLTYSNAKTEIDDFIKIYEDQARADGVPESKIQSAVKKYRGDEVSHLAKDTRTVMIDGTPVEIKNWRAANLVRDFGAVNQILTNIEQTSARDANGKIISGKSFISSLDPKEIARMSGISEREAKKELRRLERGEHPVTSRSSKVLMAVADKYLPVSAAGGSVTAGARVKALKNILAQRIADGSFFAAANSGQLSLPQNQRAAFDQEELRKQNQYLAGKKKRLGQARSRLVGPDSGVSKPATVKRAGGSTKDTKLKLLAQGETVLTNETTDNLRKGGTSSIPGVGRIRGMGKFGPIRVAGAYDGIPEGQTQDQAPRREQQRDPKTGRFVSNKAPQVAPASRFAGMGGKVAAGTSFAGMGAMMYGMSGGPGADLAMMASMPLMMAPMLAPLMALFKSPWAAAAVAIGAVITSVILLKNTFTDAQKEALKTSEALGSSKEAMAKLSEFAGTVSSGEVMDRVRKNRMQLVTRATGKTTFGEAFVQTEDGKATLDAAKKQLATGGSDSVINSLTSQLSTAVVSGVLTPEQAKSMAANLAYELGDMKVGIQVTANLVDLLGPDGQSLTGAGILEFSAKMNERSMESINGQMEMLRKNVAQSPIGTELQRNVSIGGMIAAGAGVGAAAGAGIGSLGAGVMAAPGAVIGTIAGAVTGAVAGFNLMAEETKRIGALSGAVVGEMMNSLEAQQEISDALDAYYIKKIEEAKVQGDITEQLRLQAEYEGKKREISEQEVQMRGQLRQALEVGGPGAEATRTGIQSAIDTRFKDDSAAQLSLAPALASLDRLRGSNQISQTDQDIIKLELATTMDPAALNSLLMFVGEDEKQVDALVNIIGNFGGTFATEAQNVLNLVEDEDLRAKIFVDISNAGNEVDAQNTMNFVREISKQNGVLKTDIILNYFVANPGAQAELQRIFEDVENKGVKEVTQAYEINPKLNDPDAFDEAYFNMLNEGDKEQYVKTISMILAMDEIEVVKSDDFQKWTKDEGLKFGSYPGSKSNSWWQKRYAEDQGVKVTVETPSADTAAAPEEEETSGGSGGPAASSLDDILKKLRDVRKNQIGVTKGFEASANAINKLFGDGKGINLFSGLENDMRKLGAGEDLISLIAGMDPEEFEKKKNTLFNFDKQTGEIIGFKSQLKNIGQALSAIALGEYVSQQQKQAQESKNQVLAFNQLRAAGYSVAEAYEAIQNASLSAALAAGDFTKNQIREMLETQRAAAEAMKQAERLTPEGLQEVFEKGFNMAMEAFDAKERKLTLEYEFKIADDEALIEQAQNQIAAIQYQLDDYEADLRGIEDQEEAINKTYDEKLEALEKVRKANQKVLDQEKGRLSVAEAITRGDLAAAARAAQDVRATSASGYFSSQADALNAGRRSALDAVRGEGGLSRIEIEEKIKNLTNQIFEIEENTLEPANERVRLAGLELKSRIDELTELGKTRKEWEFIKAEIDVSRVNSIGYKEAMEEALGVVEDIKNAWAGIQSKEIVLTTIQRTITEGQVSGGGGGGGGGGGSLDSAAAKAAAITAATNAVTEAERNLAQFDRDRTANIPALERALANAVASRNVRQIENAEAALVRAKTVTVDSSDRKLYVQAVTAAQNRLASAQNATYADGGFVSGPGTSTSDSILAMLSNGEYVVKADSVGKYGRQMLEDINSGSFNPKPISATINMGRVAGGMSAPRTRPMSTGPTRGPVPTRRPGLVPSRGASPQISSPVQRPTIPSFASNLSVPPPMSPNFSRPNFTKRLSQQAFRSPSLPKAEAISSLPPVSKPQPNNSTNHQSSVYNYNLSVNVASQSDPNTIAQTVMSQIRSVDSQRIRGSRF
jgi:TP901 family phage tail tape measure protein